MEEDLPAYCPQADKPSDREARMKELLARQVQLIGFSPG
jgi:hypothetical protein